MRFTRHNAALAARAVPEWRAALDALRDHAGGPWDSGACRWAVPSAGVTVPVEFRLQWDDELVPRDSGFALFAAFGSGEKTLHANPGRHMDVPAFELESSVRFFARHLGEPGQAPPEADSG